MSTTTAGDLLDRADRQARALQGDSGPTSLRAWVTFEHTAHRLLRELVGPLRTTDPKRAQVHAALAQLLDDFPALPRPKPRTAGHDLAETQPATVTSHEPLDQLSVTLGALADLLAGARTRDLHTWTGSELDRMMDDTQTAPLIAHLMTITVAAGRRTLAGLPPDQTERPATVIAYAEHALEGLGTFGQESRLLDLPSFHPPVAPATPNERLESALRAWVAAARDELAQTAPSTDVLRNITNQAIHVYAAADHLLDLTAPGHAEDGGTSEALATVRASLRNAAAELQRAEPLWATVTTATRPREAYVAAASVLFDNLNETLAAGAGTPGTALATAKGLNLEVALTDLRYAMPDLADLLHDSAEVADTLARSGVLFAPARVLPGHLDRLRATLLGRWAALRPEEGAQLRHEAHAAAGAARVAHAVMSKADTAVPAYATLIATNSEPPRLVPGPPSTTCTAAESANAAPTSRIDMDRTPAL